MIFHHKILNYKLISLLDIITNNNCYLTLTSLRYSLNLKWRYGQVVRQWIANPLSPVRIWVPPDINILYCFFFKQRYN